MRLLEMYPAVQGEGTLMGVPSTFIRLAGCTVGCSWCCTKNTIISTFGGFDKKISEIEVGDKVFGYDEHLRRTVVRKVTKIYHRRVPLREMVRICWGRGSRQRLYITKNHEIFVERQGEGRWIPAGDIVVGDVFKNPIDLLRRLPFVKTSKIRIVEEVREVTTRMAAKMGYSDGLIDVYNLEVEGVHNYFANGILVHNCDTKYSWKASQGEDVSPEEIYRRAKEMTTHGHVVLTGGEPLEHPELEIIELIRLLQTQFHVTVETSGTSVDPREFVPQTRIWDNVLWSVSPKLGSARAKKPFPDLSGWQEAARRMRHRLQLKFVVASRDDFQEFLEILVSPGLVIDPEVTTPILQVATPVGSLDAVRETVLENLRVYQEEIVEKRLAQVPNLRILPQLHALIYGNKRGV